MADHHTEGVPNPDYDGPNQHCLPPQVHDTVGGGIYFTIITVVLILGAAAMGAALILTDVL